LKFRWIDAPRKIPPRPAKIVNGKDATVAIKNDKAAATINIKIEGATPCFEVYIIKGIGKAKIPNIPMIGTNMTINNNTIYIAVNKAPSVIFLESFIQTPLRLRLNKLHFIISNLE